jgi:rod shape-determining protein MreC
VANNQRRGFLKNCNLWVFAILFIFSISSYSTKANLKLNIVRRVSEIAIYPFEKTTTSIKNVITVYRENMVLRKEIAVISLKIQRCTNIKRENKILRELYSFKPMIDYNLIPCEIIGKNPGLYNSSIIIDGGIEDSIQKNMPVISAKGLVGKIIEISQKSSELVTLYNRSSFVSAIALRSRVHGIVKWQSGGVMVLDDVPLHSDIKAGDTLLTSGMGGVFPKGIFIGEVIKVEESPKEIVMKIEIVPFVDYSLLEEVFVITESKTTITLPVSVTESIKIPGVNLDLFKTIRNPQSFVPYTHSDSKK